MTTTRPERTPVEIENSVFAVTVGVAPPTTVDRLVLHQFDAARPSPGGIDTCLRGLLRYAPAGAVIAVVGVDTGAPVPGRRLGQWERHECAGRQVWFLPVVRLDPADQRRLVPHSLRLAAGLVRFRRRLPAARLVQAHRADTAAACRVLLRRPLAYFIHTQQAGLTGSTSDSIWRRAARLHAAIERWLVRGARSVTVFNPDYAEAVRRENPRAEFSPTWFDPDVVRPRSTAAERHRIIWVGRLEAPKDPTLAVRTFARLVETDPASPWALDVVGTGTRLLEMERLVATLPGPVRARVRLLGRLEPDEVAEAMAASGVFLMTSHPGYEGFPRVLVEAMASGLPAVVTDGSDTGGLVVPGRTGYVCEREPDDIAQAIRGAVDLDRDRVSAGAARYSAPQLVARILGDAERS